MSIMGRLVGRGRMSCRWKLGVELHKSGKMG
jgi:hypothetical protein